jgi:Zn-dependent peptidase ImmA (M78 family)
MSSADLTRWLDEPPARQETILKKIASALLVPDFFLFLDDPPDLANGLVDFRFAKPRARGYERDTQKWIDLATSIQRDVRRLKIFDSKRSIDQLLSNARDIKASAQKLRAAIGLTVKTQIEIENPRLLFSYLRKNIEQYEILVLQLSFPDKDGIGFAVTSDETFDVIVINTLNQLYPRRIFTLAHEIYHCVLNQSGISDPFSIKNDIERQCNRFAIEFLAPKELVEYAATHSIRTKNFNIGELKAFSKLTKLSLHASVLRLVETNHYNESAIAAWQSFIKGQPNPDFAKAGGGQRQEEWKYKLSRYGFRFAEIYKDAKQREEIDDYELYRLSGIKPKFQSSYLTNASSASIADAEDEANGD